MRSLKVDSEGIKSFTVTLKMMITMIELSIEWFFKVDNYNNNSKILTHKCPEGWYL